MATLFLSLLLASPFLAPLASNIWRDRRGARRNAAGCCYTCGCPLTGSAQPISHDKGETYIYCGPCASWHRGLSSAAALAAFGVALAAGAILVLAR